MALLCRLLAGLVLSALACAAQGASIKVLWYTYADPASEYRSFYSTLAATGSPQSTGLTWDLTFFGPNDPSPAFEQYNVLVIHSGEAFRTGKPGMDNNTPDYSGIFRNKAAIDAARGNRTLISGSDADFHAVRGDSGSCGAYCFDGALGYVINAINWTGGGDRLGILSFVDGDFPGSFWWDKADSFLKTELSGYVLDFLENNVIIDALEQTYPMNQGLTSAGLSHWTNSFHAGFRKTIPWYIGTLDSSSQPNYALTIVTEAIGRIVIEYVNTTDFPNSPGGHYFYSSERAEQAAVDAGSAGAFVRTGRSFLVGGPASVCRFYGSVNPGPNSHFFTVDEDECSALRALQATPPPAAVQQWNYEGIGFTTTPVSVAVDGTRTCAEGTLPVYRAYNNAFPLSGPKNPWDSNHRFALDPADITALVAIGWRNEGVVFCAASR